MTQDEKIAEYKKAHDKRQVGLKDNQICIREGIVLDISEKSRFPFEFFTFRSPEMVSEMDWFINYADGKKCFIDIGAHHGLFSLVFEKINHGARVLSIEPSLEPLEALFENMFPVSNKSIHACAVSNYIGELKMSKEWDHLTEDNEGAETIPCWTVDSIAQGMSATIDLAKIDVEGQELKVLQGMLQTIANNHPTIFLELHYTKLSKEEINSIIEIVNKFNYTVIDTDNEETIQIPLEYQGEKRVILK